jgi:ATP-dependent Lhr-like helicase
LDEEMVFESRVGETFVLGASSWRIEEITARRVLVSPAPGEPGKMPFWKGRPRRAAARSSARHRPTGCTNLLSCRRRGRRSPDARARPRARAAENLLQYLRDQLAAARAVPTRRRIR